MSTKDMIRVSKGDVVELDCEYGGGTPYYRECVVIESRKAIGLFGDVQILTDVQIIGTKEFFTTNIFPLEVIQREIPRKNKKRIIKL